MSKGPLGEVSVAVILSVDLSSLKILAITDVEDNTDNTDDSDRRRRRRRMQSNTETPRNLASKGIKIDYEIRTSDSKIALSLKDTLSSLSNSTSTSNTTSILMQSMLESVASSVGVNPALLQMTVQPPKTETQRIEVDNTNTAPSPVSN